MRGGTASIVDCGRFCGETSNDGLMGFNYCSPTCTCLFNDNALSNVPSGSAIDLGYYVIGKIASFDGIQAIFIQNSG